MTEAGILGDSFLEIEYLNCLAGVPAEEGGSKEKKRKWVTSSGDSQNCNIVISTDVLNVRHLLRKTAEDHSNLRS